MTGVPVTAAACSNLILSQLPESEYQVLKPALEYFPTPSKTVLVRRDEEIRHVYFPLSGCHSVLAVMQNGAAVEVGTIGNEGMSTVDVLTGSTVATETTVCQIPGNSLRMPAEHFRRAMDGDGALRNLSFRFFRAYLSHVSQSVACNRLHTTEERFARWILASHDRVEGNEFQLTQEYLADMLGVHRPSVTLIARRFQQAGMLDYHRGIVTILDRKGLEEAACECYAQVRKQFARALGKPMG
ncbi:Crp/Fnr family transcriptional regulator [Noviherbaspirillum galbum]|uniref:Crp/Fnr family transcriptional regulator n=1 Tax=Noviherbaspirillum galbum TaxID=2709383 RepID=A0A6B3SMH7_9BURK|nr:Crp/Fnr family transcriptional regulator [Noviherbaspirillum galbum]NEX61933.1 Crp/Fnr family transcriptional regulator [Noviherbaspirillum galbum]